MSDLATLTLEELDALSAEIGKRIANNSWFQPFRVGLEIHRWPGPKWEVDYFGSRRDITKLARDVLFDQKSREQRQKDLDERKARRGQLNEEIAALRKQREDISDRIMTLTPAYDDGNASGVLGEQRNVLAERIAAKVNERNNMDATDYHMSMTGIYSGEGLAAFELGNLARWLENQDSDKEDESCLDQSHPKKKNWWRG